MISYLTANCKIDERTPSSLHSKIHSRVKFAQDKREILQTGREAIIIYLPRPEDPPALYEEVKQNSSFLSNRDFDSKL